MFEIYLIANDFSDKKYIGQTTQGINRRFQQHKNTLNTHIGRSIHYHGAEHYSITVIDTAETQQDADRLERQYIKQYDTMTNGYNLRPGGVLDYGDEYKKNVGINFRVSGNKLRIHIKNV